MRTLIIGGAASGKSGFAEQLAQRSGGPVTYIAAMRPDGEEALRRIMRHRQTRADKGFFTVERYRNLGGLRLERRGAVLLECLGNLAANELFDSGSTPEKAKAAILDGIAALERQSGHVILVSNDIFRDGVRYDRETRRYMALLAGLHVILAERFEHVAEVVCGIPIWRKGGGA